MTTIRSPSVLVIASLLLISHSVAGQAVYGNIIGIVTDSSCVPRKCASPSFRSHHVKPSIAIA